MRQCPQCRAVLPADAPQGLCPACLMTAALGQGSRPSWSGSREESAVQAESSPPTAAHSQSQPGAGSTLSLSELARLFPALEIIEQIGRGGMGVVYKARQKSLERIVALKVIAPDVIALPHFTERFAREARALARLNHPNIVAVYDFGSVRGAIAGVGGEAPAEVYYLIMEFVGGANLRTMLRQLTPEQSLAIVPQICEALQYAHDEGVVHRDIKPENILIDARGRVKIADFGLAKLLGQQAADYSLTQSQAVMGTPRYMAPEQLETPLSVDHRADIYSLGVVFYEMLTGELPMGRFQPPSAKVHVDVRLDEVVLKSLEKEPQRRYQHASEVRSNVESIRSSAAGQAAACPRTTPQARHGLPAPVWSFVLAICTMLLSLIAFAMIVGSGSMGATELLASAALAGIWLYSGLKVLQRRELVRAIELGHWPQPHETPTPEHVRRLALSGHKVLAVRLQQIIDQSSLAAALAKVEQNHPATPSAPPARTTPRRLADLPPEVRKAVRWKLAALSIAALTACLAGLALGIVRYDDKGVRILLAPQSGAFKSLALTADFSQTGTRFGTLFDNEGQRNRPVRIEVEPNSGAALGTTVQFPLVHAQLAGAAVERTVFNAWFGESLRIDVESPAVRAELDELVALLQAYSDFTPKTWQEFLAQVQLKMPHYHVVSWTNLGGVFHGGAALLWVAAILGAYCIACSIVYYGSLRQPRKALACGLAAAAIFGAFAAFASNGARMPTDAASLQPPALAPPPRTDLSGENAARPADAERGVPADKTPQLTDAERAMILAALPEPVRRIAGQAAAADADQMKALGTFARVIEFDQGPADYWLETRETGQETFPRRLPGDKPGINWRIAKDHARIVLWMQAKDSSQMTTDVRRQLHEYNADLKVGSVVVPPLIWGLIVDGESIENRHIDYGDALWFGWDRVALEEGASAAGFSLDAEAQAAGGTMLQVVAKNLSNDQSVRLALRFARDPGPAAEESADAAGSETPAP